MQGTNTRQAERRYEIDWLTILATLMILLYHCARFFNHGDWHVKNAQESDALSLFVAFTEQWIMPLFFLLSGMSARLSLRVRGPGRYLGERGLRLGVPLLFATFVVLIPVQVWVERVGHGDYFGSFAAFYPHYFDGLYAFGGNFAWMGLHLWYLEMLLLFSLLTLPALLWLLRPEAEAFGTRLARRLRMPGGTLLLFLPLLGMELLVNLAPQGLGMRAFGGWSPASYLVLFLLGHLLATGSGWREAFARGRFAALACAPACTVLLYALPQSPGASGSYVVSAGLRALHSWAWLAAILGVAVRRLDFDHPSRARLRALALPFYILHQTVIVLIGFGIADWELPVALKYPLLVIASFVSVAFCCEFVIRRFAITRLLFGMRVRRAPVPAPDAVG